MKKAQPRIKAESSLADTKDYTCDHLTSFPLWLNETDWEVLSALFKWHARYRDQIDKIAGVANGPAVIARLRGYGLQIPGMRFGVIKRNGRTRRRWLYYLSAEDREKARAVLDRQAGMQLPPQNTTPTTMTPHTGAKKVNRGE